MSNFLICRIENYKMNQAIGVNIELDHLEERGYSNPDWDKTKTCENVSLEHDEKMDGKTFPQYVKDYREENNIQGRMTTSGKEKSQTNVLTQCVITTSPEYMDSLSRSEQIDFFKSGLKAFKEMYPTYHITDARIHFDEKTPHLQINSLPIYYNKDKDILQFSTTETQKGKYHYRDFQNHMYQEMSKTYNLERGIASEERKIKHQDKDTWERLQEKEKQLDQREKELSEKEKAAQERYNQYKDMPVPTKTIFGKEKYNTAEVEKLVNDCNALVAQNEKLKQGYNELRDKAISQIDRVTEQKEQALWERDLATQERDKAIQIGRNVDNKQERNKQLDRLETYGVTEAPERQKTREHDIDR